MPDPVVDLDALYPCRCPDCGAELMSPEALAEEPGRIRRALHDRKLVVPESLYSDLRRLEAEVRCRLGLCGGKGGR